MIKSTGKLGALVVCLIGILTLCPEPARAQRADLSPSSNDRTNSEKAFTSFAGEMNGGLFQVTRLMAGSIPWGGARVNEYISRLGGNLARASGTAQALKFQVLYSPEVNAWALPGGTILVNSGVITAAEDEAELAAVLAHEIAHVNAGHARRRAIGLVAGPGARLKDRVEREADRLAAEYLSRSGYDPEAAQRMLDRLRNLKEGERLRISSWRLGNVLGTGSASKFGNTSEFFSVRDEVLRYDKTYARVVGLPLPGDAPSPPRLSRRPPAAIR